MKPFLELNLVVDSEDLRLSGTGFSLRAMIRVDQIADIVDNFCEFTKSTGTRITLVQSTDSLDARDRAVHGRRIVHCKESFDTVHAMMVSAGATFQSAQVAESSAQQTQDTLTKTDHVQG